MTASAPAEQMEPFATRNGDRLLTDVETADLIRTSSAHLKRMRQLGTGPRYVRCGRWFRYWERDVMGWIEQRTHQATAEYSRRGRPRSA